MMYAESWAMAATEHFGAAYMYAYTHGTCWRSNEKMRLLAADGG